MPTRSIKSFVVVSTLLLSSLISARAFGQPSDPRGVKVRTPEVEAVLGTGASIPRYHALVIGINKYRHMQSLRRARPDAEEVAGLLSTRYGFQTVTTLYDQQATRTGISLALRRQTEQLGENDALLVFYAGHGYFDKLLNRGYWIPHEARESIEGAPAITDWFSNNELQDFVSALRARHVLVVSDSCFSGSLFRGAVPDLSTKENAWYRRALQQPSRWGISSGDLELVPDSSAFARQFVNALQYPLKPVFSASDIAGRIKVEVAGATGTQPLFGRLQVDRDSQFGEFVFLDYGAVRIQTVPPSQADLGSDSTRVDIWSESQQIGAPPPTNGSLETATDLKSANPLVGSPTHFGSRVRDNTWSISFTNLMNYYEDLLDNPERLLSLFDSFVPYLVNGSVVGYSVKSMGEDVLLRAADLRDGDIVRGVNSLPITNRGRSEYFMREVIQRRLSVLVLDIDRNGTAVKHIYEIR